ncbi:hypothetical protein E2C01_070801 [Portunus trituberculatus]|uniref:Methyltransferase FkbM domain-containing protein n=1 Tax=Portunus trituberculatus TaxID=210409 RepID=A0A5B7HTP9_PORTR|nr:hypothetical protein [Portunus trituberculatus]
MIQAEHNELCFLQTNRYCNILTELGHPNSIINILKIDVEGCELFFKDVLERTPNLLKNVKLIAMENNEELRVPGGTT